MFSFDSEEKCCQDDPVCWTFQSCFICCRPMPISFCLLQAQPTSTPASTPFLPALLRSETSGHNFLRTVAFQEQHRPCLSCQFSTEAAPLEAYLVLTRKKSAAKMTLSAGHFRAVPSAAAPCQYRFVSCRPSPPALPASTPFLPALLRSETSGHNFLRTVAFQEQHRPCLSCQFSTEAAPLEAYLVLTRKKSAAKMTLSAGHFRAVPSAAAPCQFHSQR